MISVILTFLGVFLVTRFALYKQKCKEKILFFKPIQALISSIENIGKSFIMLLKVIFHLPNFRRNTPIFLEQIKIHGFYSLGIIGLAAFFIGAVLAIQGYAVLSRFKSENMLGAMVALSVLRELAPVVTALLFAGKSGSSLTAELALMRATQQIDSYEMMAINPLHRVVTPRFWAAIITLPLLTIIFMSISIAGSALVGIGIKEIDYGAFYGNIVASTNMGDIYSGVIKSIIFVCFITWISIYKGYYAKKDSTGISYATTSCVVLSSVMILALDLVLTVFMFS